jgi:hypothetical protein
MYQVEDDQHVENEPLETIHLYVVREGQQRPSLLPVIISVVALCLLIAVGILIPYKQPEERITIKVPAILLPLRSFSASVAIIPTGVKTYPATTAHGTLTITNGSILQEELPAGLILTGKDGVEVVTDQAAYVPPGSATSLGYATVSAHAASSGKSGNISTLDINAVEGTALFIRNLAAFSGGADSYSVPFVTDQDRETALSQARAILLPQTLSGLLDSPCKETITGSQTLHVRWTCQYVTYQAPQGKVLSVKVQGQQIILEIELVVRPRILTVK